MSRLLPDSPTRAADLIKIPPPPFLFDGFIRQQSITSLVAAPHSYKSFIMLAMALALDYNLPLFGRFQPTGIRKSFFIGADAPDWDYGQVFHKLLQGYNISPPRRALCSVTGIFDEHINLMDKAFLDWLADYDKREGFDVLFLDSLRATTLVNENNSQEVAAVNRVLKQWRAMGKTVIYAHHTAIPSGEQGNRPEVYAGRGSGDMAAACDFQFNLSILNKAAVGNRQVRITPAKARGLASPPDLDIIEAVYEDRGELNARNEPVPAVSFRCGNAPPRRQLVDLVYSQLQLAPRTRGDLLAYMKLESPKEFNQPGAYKLIDNTLQQLKREGKAKSISTGIWASTDGIQREGK